MDLINIYVNVLHHARGIKTRLAVMLLISFVFFPLYYIEPDIHKIYTYEK